MDGQDGVGRAQLGALVDDFLRTAFNLGIAALHRVKVQAGRVGTRGHGTGSAAAHAYAHAGAAQLYQQGAGREKDFFGQARVNRADAAGDHDGLVVTPALAAHGLFVFAEITGQIGPAEFIVEGRAAEWAL
ncbi:hypothetical protein D9M73_64890 [compost metagenome]